MRDVTVNKQNLLKKLEENRGRHREVFLMAQTAYREMVIVELDKRLQQARDGRNINQYLGLIPPQDHTVDYDMAIEMLQMEVADTVRIDSLSFANFVLDRWNWKEQFSNSASMFVGKFALPADYAAYVSDDDQS